jgi:hypothetical protein
MKYRKKPVTIEATQWNGCMTGIRAIEAMHKGLVTTAIDHIGENVKRWEIRTLEGVHRVSIGDWIIKGVKGEFYLCKPDIFEMDYDAVDSVAS